MAKFVRKQHGGDSGRCTQQSGRIKLTLKLQRESGMWRALTLFDRCLVWLKYKPELIENTTIIDNGNMIIVTLFYNRKIALLVSFI